MATFNFILLAQLFLWNSTNLLLSLAAVLLRHFIRKRTGLTLNFMALIYFSWLFTAGRTFLKNYNHLWIIMLPTVLSFGLGFYLNRTELIGVTGGIASGKSSLSRFISTKIGWPVVDCDLIAQKLRQKGQPGYQFIVKKTGKQFLNAEGILDRQKYSQFVFNNAAFRRQFTAYMGRHIFKHIIRQILGHLWAGRRAILVDAPILFQSKVLQYFLFPIITVYVSESTQLERLKARNSLSEEESLRRIRSQMSSEQRISKSDIAVRNEKSREEMFLQVLKNLKTQLKWMCNN